MDTIIAISTPPGNGLKGIIRLSGPAAFMTVNRVFKTASIRRRLKPSSTKHPRNLALSGQLYLKNITIPATVFLMKAPHSYTRENMMEIHTIGAQPLLQMILEYFISRKGIRLAQPGEFTKRAFLNGRINLAQAEAVLNIIKSHNDRACSTAQQQLSGHFSRRIKVLQQSLIDLVSRIELGLDFSDQEIEIITPSEVKRSIASIAGQISRMLAGRTQSLVHKDGITCVLCGRPNVGKSSIFNRLVPDRKNIVSPLLAVQAKRVIRWQFEHSELLPGILGCNSLRSNSRWTARLSRKGIPGQPVPPSGTNRGTTRDYIEGVMDYKGIRFRIIDTAGISGLLSRSEIPPYGGTDCTFASLSVNGLRNDVGLLDKTQRQTHQILAQADVYLVVIDGHTRLPRGDLQIVKDIDVHRLALIINKCDLGAKVRHITGKAKVFVKTSAKTGAGITRLKDNLVKLVREGSFGQPVPPSGTNRDILKGDITTVNARHQECLRKSLESLNRAIKQGMSSEPPCGGAHLMYELVTVNLREALNCLGEIAGETITDDILNNIFSRFCIGK